MFVAFAREHNLLDLFETSRLKDVFHWYPHFDILNKSLFICTTDTLTSSSIENKDPSSAKSFGIEEICLPRSFKKERKEVL